MTPRPLYRWKSFWFGVLVIAFLGWAWVRSNSRLEGFGYSTKIAGFGIISQGSGRVSLKVNDGMVGTDFFSVEDREVQTSPPAFEITRWDAGQGWGVTTSYTIAHWFLILLFIVPWCGWLAWRSRQLRRLRIANKVEGIALGRAG